MSNKVKMKKFQKTKSLMKKVLVVSEKCLSFICSTVNGYKINPSDVDDYDVHCEKSHYLI